MIDLLSLYVLLSHFRPCDWFSREQFLPTWSVSTHVHHVVLFGKTIVHAEKVYFAGRECFSAAQGGAGAHFAE